MYRPYVDSRLLPFSMIIMAGLAVLVWQLWRVQVVDGPMYAARIRERSEVTVRIPPIRGEIRDRNGIVLAQNRPRFDVDFYLPAMVRAYRERNDGAVPLRHYRGRVRGMLKVLPMPDVEQIVNTAVMPRLDQLGLPRELDGEDLLRHYRTETEIPYTYLEGADFHTVAKFAEHDIGLPGVGIAVKPSREYPFGALASHLLGYVGEPEELSQLPDIRDFNFYDPNVEGKVQVERLMDPWLRGTPGVRVMERDVRGAIDREMRRTPPIPGDSVALTIDARIQFIAERALRAVSRAGAVVVDPNNGDILAMASVPSYDPNVFIPSISAADWKRIVKDETDPLLNRALAAFPPGSTFKLVTSLGGVRAGTASRTFTCSGGVQYGNHFFKCWKTSGHGTLGLSEAIKVSCNAFFYQYANAAGIDAIDTVGSALGLGRDSGLGLDGEQPGVLPSPDWLRKNFPMERWSSAYTANVAIGQGYDLVSPLQLVMAYSAVANGGTAYFPRLIKSVTNCDGSPVMRDDGEPVAPPAGRVRANLLSMGITEQGLETIRQGLWKVVNENGGTARRARLKDVVVAGKTGTAQAKRDGHEDTVAWFVCFAPFEQPKYAVCVMVQGGAHGGSVAAPIAAKILDETLAMDRAEYAPQLVALKPAARPNPFRMIESVDVESAAPQPVAAADEEPASASAPPVTASVRKDPPKPTIKRSRRTVEQAPDREVRRAEPVLQPRKNFFRWLFGNSR